MSEFARHLPMPIFLRLVDLPAEEREWLVGRAEITVRRGDPETRLQAQRDIVAYLERWIAMRRKTPDDDLLSAIVHGMVGDRSMTQEEVLGEAMEALFGGLGTVASILGFIMGFWR